MWQNQVGGKKRVADIVVETLIRHGITNAFSVTGGGSIHLNHAFTLAQDQLRTVYNHHEQACALAAEGYAKTCGKPAVVCVTSGPGSLNTLNGVQGAWTDSVPMIVIAGFPRYDTTVKACGLDLRCRGVQENDIIPQVKNITKYARMVLDPLAVRAEVTYAIEAAMSGRRGPVWLTFPLDVQGMMVRVDELYPDYESPSMPPVNGDDMDELYRMFHEAKRPCILTGSAIRTADAMQGYREFLAYTRVPVVSGIHAVDVNYIGESLFYGMSGAFGPRCGNFILQSADFILSLGNSLSTGQTGFAVEAFAPQAKIVMADAQRDESRKPGLHVSLCIEADLKDFFRACAERKEKIQAEETWIGHCEYVFKNLSRFEAAERLKDSSPSSGIHPSAFWKELSYAIEEDAVIALGNSSCVHSVLQGGTVKPLQRVIVNSNSGSMGDDIPEAVGAAVCGSAPVYCITGDGSVMMNLQEFQTVYTYHLPVKTVIFSNNGYDNIRNSYQNYFGGVGNGCTPETGVSFPDFQKLADAFGLDYYRIDCLGDLKAGIRWLVQQRGACIVEVREMENKLRAPVIASVMDENGRFFTPPLHVMTPLMDEAEMKKYLI